MSNITSVVGQRGIPTVLAIPPNEHHCFFFFFFNFKAAGFATQLRHLITVPTKRKALDTSHENPINAVRASIM